MSPVRRPTATQQRNGVSEGMALGLIMCGRMQIPFKKMKVDLAFCGAWRNWTYRGNFPQVSTDLVPSQEGAAVMTRADERKQVWLYWERGRDLVICTKFDDWDPNDAQDVQRAVRAIEGDVPLEGWVALAQDFLSRFDA